MSKLILVYDDDAQYAKTVRDAVKKVRPVGQEFDVDVLADDDFEAAFKELNGRAIRMRPGDQVPLKGTRIDAADIFIVDYDLIRSKAGEFLTGEAVAYVARCFSGCGIIVGLNQFGHNAFDLTLRGHPESFADINLGGEQIDNPNLWGAKRAGFRPWHWPSLPSFLDDFQKKIRDVTKCLKHETPICRGIDIAPDVFATLPKSIGQFLGKQPEETTFAEFARESGNCLRPRDATVTSQEVIARVAAARISKWLQRLVLPGQDIFVDAPHLVARYPSLLNMPNPKIDDWNAVTSYTSDDKCELIAADVKKYRLTKSHWFSRPVWMASDLSEDDRIDEIREPWTASRPPVVFCEDASRFYKEGEGTEFVAETDSPYARRFVKIFADVDYRPKVRLSL